jgi:cardiolipin synthase
MDAAPMPAPPPSPPRRRLRLAARPTVYAGNRVQLLVNGEQYFPALLAAIEAATHSVVIETYIFAEDRIGRQVEQALQAAAARGVRVQLTIDGFGGGDCARRLARELPPQGVAVRIFRPERWWRLERKLLRRLHRKIAVVDEALAFIGGINIIDDFTEVPASGSGDTAPRFDFMLQVRGPVVGAIALATQRLLWSLALMQGRAPAGGPPGAQEQHRQPVYADGVTASLLLRDNLRHRRSIETAYLDAIAHARDEVLIANAYFLPGRRFRAALRAAAARGVTVRLLLQGHAEYTLQHYGQQALYGRLLAAGIVIYEYTASYLHAKVAVIDGRWATVGSSNIDPYSLLLAREANLVVQDEGFAARLHGELERAIARHSRQLAPADYARRGWWARLRDTLAYSVLRWAAAVLARGRDY